MTGPRPLDNFFRSCMSKITIIIGHKKVRLFSTRLLSLMPSRRNKLATCRVAIAEKNALQPPSGPSKIVILSPEIPATTKKASGCIQEMDGRPSQNSTLTGESELLLSNFLCLRVKVGGVQVCKTAARE